MTLGALPGAFYIKPPRHQSVAIREQTSKAFSVVFWNPWRRCRPPMSRRRDLLLLLEKIAARGHVRAAGHARTLIGGLFKWGLSKDYPGERSIARVAIVRPGHAARSRTRLPMKFTRSGSGSKGTRAPVVRDSAAGSVSLLADRIGEVGGLVIAEIDTSPSGYGRCRRRARRTRSRALCLSLASLARSSRSASRKHSRWHSIPVREQATSIDCNPRSE